MNNTYFFKEGGLYENNEVKFVKFVYKKTAKPICKMLLYLTAFVCCFFLTKYVFKQCITITYDTSGLPIVKLSDCISLGSIFATFGSAIIAVLSLYSTHQISTFEENVETLNKKLSSMGVESWKRWSFLPRYSCKYIDHKLKFLILNNAVLEFELKNTSIEIPIPSVLKDFNDLPIMLNLCKLIIYKYAYLSYLQRTDHTEDYLIWDRLYAVYKSIILYQLSQLFVWLGSSFVINSFYFAFYYYRMIL